MGQIPKKIIYAAPGAKLKFKANDALKEYDEEEVDSILGKTFDEALAAGEVRESDRQAYLNSVSKLKDRMKTGTYSFDTIGKTGIASPTYTGDNTKLFGEELDKEGNRVASERSNFGKAFTSRVRRGKHAEADMDQLVLRRGLNALGSFAVDKDASDALATKEAEEKAKTDAEKAAAEEAAKWAKLPDFRTEIGKRHFAGNVNFGQSLMNMPIEEREGILKQFSSDIMNNWAKYKPLEGQSTDWLGKFKDDTGSIIYNKDFYKNFFSKLYADNGLGFISSIYGEKVPGAQTEDEVEKSEDEKKQAAIAARNAQIEWNELLKTPGVKKLEENLVDLSHRNSKMYAKDPNRLFRLLYQWDPVKSERTTMLSEYFKPTPDLTESTGIGGVTPTLPKSVKDKNVMYRLEKDPLDGSLFYVNVNDRNDKIPAESIVEAPADKDKYDYRKKGGVIKGQQGWTAAVNAPLDMGTDVWSSRRTPKTNPTVSKPVAQQESSPEVKPQDTEVKFSELGLNTADMLDLGSLAAEITAMGAAISGASPVAAGAGLTGTLASMGAEAARGELGWEDTGKYAASLALDAFSLIPGAGTAGTIAKFTRNIPTLAKLLQKGLNAGIFAYGAYQAQDEIKDIYNKLTTTGAKDLTVQDFKNLAMATTAMFSAGRAAASRKSVELKEVEGKPIQGKVMNKTTFAKQDAELIKENGAWVPKDPALRADHVVLKEGPMFGTKHVIGSREIVPAEAPTSRSFGKKSSHNPETGEKYNIFQRISVPTMPGFKKGYIAEAERLYGPRPKPAPATTPATTAATPAAPVTAPATPSFTKGVAYTTPAGPKRPLQNIKPSQQVIDSGESLRAWKNKQQGVDLLSSKNEAGKFRSTAEMRSEAARKLIEARKLLTEGAQTGLPLRPLANPRTPPKSPAKPGGRIKSKSTPTTTKTKRGSKVEYNKLAKGLSEARNKQEFLQKNKLRKGGLIPKALGGMEFINPNSPIFKATPTKFNMLGSDQDKIISALNISKGLSTSGLNYKPSTQLGTPASLTPQFKMSAVKAFDPNTQDVKLGEGPRRTIGDFIKGINVKGQSGLNAAEFFRTMALNNAIANRDTRVSSYALTTPPETQLSVKGDLGLQNFYNNQAEDYLNKARGYFGSDATRNFAMMQTANDRAEALREKGALTEAEKRKQAEIQQLELNTKQGLTRAEIANQNAKMAAMVDQAQRDKVQEGKDAIASNWNTFAQGILMDRKRKIEGVEGIVQKSKMRQALANLDMSPEYAGIYQKWLANPTDPAVNAQYQKYLGEVDKIKESVLMSKSGGTIEDKRYKHKMDMRKEKIADEKETRKILNDWRKETRKEVLKATLDSEKEIRALINKLYS